MSVELRSAAAVSPDRDTVLAWLDQGHSVPLYREILADLETPVSAYLKIAGGNHPSFLLESVESSDRLGRYSFIGGEPYSVVSMRDGVQRTSPDSNGAPRAFGDPLKVIESELARRNAVSISELPRFQGGAVGFLGYEVVRHFEELPPPGRDDLGLPDAMLMFVDTFIVFDHLHRTIKLVSQAVNTGDPTGDYQRAVARIDRLQDALTAPIDARSLPFASPRSTTLDQAPANMTRLEYERAVARTKEYIAAGDIIQAVISLRLVRELEVSAFSVYRHLRRVNPSPYMYFLDMGGFQVVGASPEMLVQAEGRRIRTRPLAGTRPRGETSDEDAALAAELMASDKERAEHVMLVDLGRNDIGRVADGGTVSVSTLMAVEKFSHVMHIVSEVEGELEPGKTGLDALRACFPAGTLSGAPKIRAMEIIAEMEPTRRGLYGGAVGYFSFSGDVDTAITIRTMVAKDGLGYVQAGAGIVADSDPEMEYNECMSKARAVMRAINLAQEAENGPRNR